MFYLKTKIRRAVINDIDTLVVLRQQLLDGSGDADYISRDPNESSRWKIAYKNWLLQVIGSEDTINIIVAEKNSKILGCAIGIIDHRAPTPDCISGISGWIQSMVVFPEWRKMGVAKIILNELLKWFETMSASKVLLQSTDVALVLYKTHGFSPEKETLLTLHGERK